MKPDSWKVFVYSIKVLAVLISAGVWVWLAQKGPLNAQELDIIATCKGFVIGMLAHLLTAGAPVVSQIGGSDAAPKS